MVAAVPALFGIVASTFRERGLNSAGASIVGTGERESPRLGDDGSLRNQQRN